MERRALGITVHDGGGSAEEAEKIAVAMRAQINGVVSKFREEIRGVLREITNGEMDGGFILGVTSACTDHLHDLPIASDPLFKWADQFAQTLVRVRNKSA